VSGCSTTPEACPAIPEARTLYQDRYVSPPARMTQRVEIIDLPENFLQMTDEEALAASGAAYKMQRTRAKQCNGQLAEIEDLAGKPADGNP